MQERNATMECTVVLMKDKATGIWAARGLEYDICSQGTSPKEAIENFVELIGYEHALAEHLGKNLRDCVPEAPRHVKNMHKQNTLEALPPVDQNTVGNVSNTSFMLKPCLAI